MHTKYMHETSAFITFSACHNFIIFCCFIYVGLIKLNIMLLLLNSEFKTESVWYCTLLTLFGAKRWSLYALSISLFLRNNTVMDTDRYTNDQSSWGSGRKDVNKKKRWNCLWPRHKVSPICILPPVLHVHPYPYVALTRTIGRNLGTF
jgi:hypothetical protein